MQCVRERTVIAGQNVTVDYTVNGARINAQPPGRPGTTAASGSVVRFTFVADAPDYFTATSPGTGTVNIAKPYRLRRSTGSGGQTILLEDGTSNPPSTTVTYTYLTNTHRQAVFATGTAEAQIIVPQYAAGDHILATEPTEGTGVSGVTWQDLNADGRAWAAL
jgi:hypothetical protein